MGQLSTRVITARPTVTAGAEGAKDAIGGKITLTDAVGPGQDVGAILDSITVIDLAANVVELDFFFFDRDFTATADNSPFDPSDADAANLIGFVRVTDWQALADWSVGAKTGIGLVLKAGHADNVAPSTNLFCQIMAVTGPTYAATNDLIVKFGFVRGDGHD